MIKLRAVAAGGLLAAVVGACGTTVPLGRVSASGSNQAATFTAGGTSGLGNGGGGAVNGTAGSGAQSISGSGSSDSGPDSNAIGAGSSTGTSTAGLPATQTPVVAGNQPVEIGVFYTSGLEQLATAFGSNESLSNPEADAKAVIAYINSHGGLAGHPVTPVWAALDVTSTTALDTQYQAACDTFTEDHHVAAVAAPTSVDDNFLTCMAKAGVPVISAWGIVTADAADFQQYPLLVVPNAPLAEQQASVLATSLVSRGWAKARWPASPTCATDTRPRVGIVFQGDTPGEHALLNDYFAPIFAKAGAPVTDTVFLDLSGSASDAIDQAAQQTESAELKFASDCVDHVIVEAPNPIVPMLFMNDASQQNYTPRYGWYSDNDIPAAQREVGKAGAQLHGSMGVGWQPYMDVPTSEFDATAKAPAAHCMAVLAAEGYPNDPDVLTCDSLLILQPIYGTRSEPISVSRFVSGVDAVGATYAPATTYGAFFSDAHRAGTSQYRDVAFNDACTCMQYSSGLLNF